MRTVRTTIRKIRHHSVQNFEQLYIDLRKTENRLHSDAELHSLPDVESTHPFANEWKLRKHSYCRLADYLRSKKQPLTILEPGCGNGWLSAKLAWLPGCKVTGLDINSTELQQAQSVFNDLPNLQFVQGDLRENLLEDKRFNVIVFASCIQYFPSLKEIIDTAFKHLETDGEVHILDSPFYQPRQLADAKRRSFEYFSALGFPQMSDCYFHHPYPELKKFQYRFMYHPGNIVSRLLHQAHPFPWIVIKKPLD